MYENLGQKILANWRNFLTTEFTKFIENKDPDFWNYFFNENKLTLWTAYNYTKDTYYFRYKFIDGKYSEKESRNFEYFSEEEANKAHFALSENWIIIDFTDEMSKELQQLLNHTPLNGHIKYVLTDNLPMHENVEDGIKISFTVLLE